MVVAALLLDDDAMGFGEKERGTVGVISGRLVVLGRGEEARSFPFPLLGERSRDGTMVRGGKW